MARARGAWARRGWEPRGGTRYEYEPVRGSHGYIIRQRSTASGLIEWHAVAFKRAAGVLPVLDEWCGNDMGSAVELVEDALR